jgi:hypothetical protein
MADTNRIIELLAILASDPSPSRGFETQESEFERHQQERQKALLELARLQNNPAVCQMLSRVTREVSSNGSIIVSELSGITLAPNYEPFAVVFVSKCVMTR